MSKHAELESEKKHFRDIATYQMNMGLGKYRETIANVTEANAESLLAFSVTATAWVLFTTADDFQTLLHPLDKSGQGLDRDKTVKALVATTSKILRTLRGVLVIIVPCWNLIVSGVFKDVAKRDWWPYAVPATPSAIEDDERLKNLESIWMRPDRPYEYQFDVLRQALKTLREDFARVSQLTVTDSPSQTRYGKLVDWTSVMSWPIQLPVAFVELVEARQPEAWVILAQCVIPSYEVAVSDTSCLKPSLAYTDFILARIVMPYFLLRLSLFSGSRTSLPISCPRLLSSWGRKCAAQSSGLPKWLALTWINSSRYIEIEVDQECFVTTKETLMVVIVFK